MAKRIAIFSDGTWNTPEQEHPTNVIRLKQFTLKEGRDNVQQDSFYDIGVGAEGKWWERILGGASGAGLNDNILDCYKYLVEHHEEGDKIFLFGFSRGAYTVRSLAGLIYNCGLFKREHAGRADEAMGIYRNRRKDAHPDSETAKRFKERYSKTSDIWFLGVWDTVGALGIPSRYVGRLFNRRYKFHDMTLNGTVKHAYHALSIDERRGAFAPSVWEKTGDGNKDVEQVWFAGVHSEVGGGSADASLPDIAFMWMMYKAQACGLDFDREEIEAKIHPSPDGDLDGSVNGIYKILTRYKRKVGKSEYVRQGVHPDTVIRFENPEHTYNPPQLTKYLNPTGHHVADRGPFPDLSQT